MVAVLSGIVITAVVLQVPDAAAAGPGWSVSSSANNGTNDNELNDVSCISVTSCKAVGEYLGGGSWRTLIESWNGHTWSVSSSPNGGLENYLLSVSCVSASSCKAVGDYYSNTTDSSLTLIESWNGRTWSITPSPNVGTSGDQLNGVACVSATSCKAVGSAPDRTLIESWNGHTWSVSSSPNKSGTIDDELSSVSCVSATSCKAAGDYYENDINDWRTLIESWNGHTWSRSSSPNLTGKDDHLSGISCGSATSCEAVGFYDDQYGGGESRGLIESWSGTAWSIESSPDIIDPAAISGGESLSAVSCALATSCEAPGWYSERLSAGVGKKGNPLTKVVSGVMIDFLNGTTWSIAANTTEPYRLAGISCVSATSCKAVGQLSTKAGVEKTLVESYG
jgi:hypothetical protein